MFVWVWVYMLANINRGVKIQFNAIQSNIPALNNTFMKLIIHLLMFHFSWSILVIFALLRPSHVNKFDDKDAEKAEGVWRVWMIGDHVLEVSTHQSSSVSFCRPLWVTPSRSSSSWRTRSVASVSLLLTSSLSSDRPCDERSSSYGTERQLWITLTGPTANHSSWFSRLNMAREKVLDKVRSLSVKS